MAAKSYDLPSKILRLSDWAVSLVFSRDESVNFCQGIDRIMNMHDVTLVEDRQ